MNTLERVARAIKARAEQATGSGHEWAVSPEDIALAALEALLEPSEGAVEASAKAAYNQLVHPRYHDTDWPDSRLSVDAEGFRDCARAAHRAMIQAALDGN